MIPKWKPGYTLSLYNVDVFIIFLVRPEPNFIIKDLPSVLILTIANQILLTNTNDVYVTIYLAF